MNWEKSFTFKWQEGPYKHKLTIYSWQFCLLFALFSLPFIDGVAFVFFFAVILVFYIVRNTPFGKLLILQWGSKDE